MVRLESGVKFRVGGVPGVREIVMEKPYQRAVSCFSLRTGVLRDESNQLPPNDLKWRGQTILL